MEGCTELRLENIRPSELNPRGAMDEAALADLVASVRVHGILCPILVREARFGSGHFWEIVAGHRRYAAAQEVGLKKIPAVMVRRVDGRHALELMLVENVQREDLDPIEEAQAYQRLISECGYTQQKLAERVGKTQPHISATLRMLDLPVDVQHLVKRGEISRSHGKRLQVLTDRPDEVRRLAKQAVNGLSVHQLDRVVKTQTGGKLNRAQLREDALRAFVTLLDGRTEPLQPEEWAGLLADAKTALGLN